MIPKKPSPANIVIFGGKGDLTRRKLIPALFNLYTAGFLPAHFSIYAVHYEKMAEKDYRDYMLEAVNTFSRNGKATKEQWKKFSAHLFFFEGDFTTEATYRGLSATLNKNDKAWSSRAVRLFYYSVAPRFIKPISLLLSQFHLAAKANADRIVVEKPFGTDLQSARELNQLLTTHFSEKQLFRIDHYLGKETVQNLMAFRFANVVFESIWNNKYIDHVQITVAEHIGVGDRGSYYDQAGALKDMIQNHLLQLLCITGMEPPISFDAEEVRNKKADVLKALRPLTKADIGKNVTRGQYGEGEIDGKKQAAYRKEKNVNPGSVTETFVALKLFIDNWRWKNVPFYLRTGKCLSQATSVIVIQFKPVPHNLFGPGIIMDGRPNQLIISIQPEMEITLLFHAKEPGVQMKIKPVEMDFTYKENYTVAVPEAYETLLLDVLEGDATLFMRADQVEEAWKVVTPVMETWKKQAAPRFPNYAPGSWGPGASSDLIKEQGCGWILLPANGTTKIKIKKRKDEK